MDSLDLQLLTAKFHRQGEEAGLEDGLAHLWIGNPGDRQQIKAAFTRDNVNRLIDDLQILQRKMLISPKRARWYGDVPATCQVTGRPITNAFVDGQLKGNGAWCMMHPDAHKDHGTGLGTGRGQRFEKHDGAWYKMEG